MTRRKNLLWALALAMATALPVSAQTLIGHWALDETGGSTATDAISGNNGTWQNGATTNLSRVEGLIGLRAANLSDAGGNNFFQIPSIGALNGANGLSISAWIDPDAQTNTGYNGIFMTRAFNAGGGSSWGIAIENGGGEHLDSRVQNGARDSAGGSLLNTAGWHHVAMVWDGNSGTHTQYINGVQTSTGGGAIAGPITNPTGPWMIGYDPCCGGTRDFDGVIDDASVWSGALTGAQVSRIYHAGLDGVDAASALTKTASSGSVQNGLVGSWNMDQPSGSIGAPDSINHNNAMLSGANIGTAWVAGQIGRALDLDGSNDQAIVSSLPQINGENAMTISMWVRNDGGNEGYEGLFQHRSGDNSNQQGLMTPSNQINPNGPNQPNDVMGRLLNNGTIITTPGNSIPTGGVWTHVVQRYEGGVLHEILIDGVVVAADAAPPNLPIVSDGAWRFGNDVCCGNRFFNGAIDDTALYNRALSDAEVNAIRTAGLNGISHTRAFIPVDDRTQNDLVGHWTFDQARFHPTANDSIGGANAALTNMDSGADWIAGQAGGALRFDGGNDQAIISGSDAAALNAALNGSTALTMSIWVRQDGANENNEGIFEHRGPGNANLTGFNTPGSATDNIQFRINSTPITSDANVLANGQWQHLVGVWEAGERFEIWIDGVLAEEDTAPGGSLVAAGDWRFGNDICCGNRFFEGALDDAALWDRALTRKEILGLYLAGVDGFNAQQAVATPEPVSIALWTILGLGLAGFTYLRKRKS